MPPDQATLQAIEDRISKLGVLVNALRRQDVRDPVLADVEIYHKAALWIVRHNEFYQREAGQWTLDALDRGILRARHLAQGEAPWYQHVGRTVVHGYRSRVDGSVQPYAVTLPADYGKDRNKKWRVDVVLHGRDPSLSEIKFVQQHAGDTDAPREQAYVQLDIYGRGNLAYRWAGETDVWEAIEGFLAAERSLGREPLLDQARGVLRGFSMGGAGTWQIGLHTPSRWCVLGPGAGFTTTHGYVRDLPELLPPYQEKCLRIYDAVDYAENAFNVPIVAYGGDQDPQLQAARNIEARLKPLGIPLQILVAPGLAHRFPPEWQKKAAAAYAPFVARGRADYPPHVHFVTYTLRYPVCAWVEIDALERHYERALVDAQFSESGYQIQTANVRNLHLTVSADTPSPVAVTIDGQGLTPRPYLAANNSSHLYLERRDGRWSSVLPHKLLTERLRRPRKHTGQQGPIDDAFMDAFLCVRGTGTPWQSATQRLAEESLQRFADEWAKYQRGLLPVKRDDEITEEDLAGKHLILFGDPGSNSLLAQLVGELPLKWNRETIQLGGKSYPAQDHVPVLIYPSPLNYSRYIVVNSGHTFHAADFQGTNALLYPRLGDYAVLKSASGEAVMAGLFDDQWQP
jgi:hypothetical protein